MTKADSGDGNYQQHAGQRKRSHTVARAGRSVCRGGSSGRGGGTRRIRSGSGIRRISGGIRRRCISRGAVCRGRFGGLGSIRGSSHPEAHSRYNWGHRQN